MLFTLTSVDRLIKYSLDKWKVRWIKNWPNEWAQGVCAVAQSPVGGKSVVVYPVVQYWGQYYSTSSLMTWIMG